MSDVEAIEARIRSLPQSDFSKLREWFYEFENTRWDKQIATDFKAGKLSRLIEKARMEYAQGTRKNSMPSIPTLKRFRQATAS